MNNKTRIIDLNVGQLLQLLNNRDLPVKEQKKEKFLMFHYEKELIEEYFIVPKENDELDYIIATKIKIHIEEKTGKKIRNMKYFGMALKNIFGKPVQKRGIGFCYKVKFK